MKKLLTAVLILVALTGCATHYSAEDLTKLKAKEVAGVVNKQSLGSFTMQDETGEERTYRTGQQTEYIPKGYRSQLGDTVRVAFQEVWESSGRAKLAVLQLEAVNIPENNHQLKNPIIGELVSVGNGSMQFRYSIFVKIPGREDATIFYIHSTDTRGQLNGKNDVLTGDQIPATAFEKLIGQKIILAANRVPILRGNGYIYIVKEVRGPLDEVSSLP